MSTRGRKEFRRRRTFPVTRRLSTNRVRSSTLKRRFFGKFDPLMKTFLECETMCREPSPGHVFVGTLAEIDPRKVTEVVRRSRHIRSLQYTAIRSDIGSPIKILLRPQCQGIGNINSFHQTVLARWTSVTDDISLHTDGQTTLR